MGAVNAVLVRLRHRLNLEGAPDEELLCAHLHRLRPLEQRRRDEDLDTLVLRHAVTRQVLALQVGVDRHLSPARSGKGRDEVERHRATAILREL